MLITVRNLVKKIEKKEVLSGVQFDIGLGEFIVLLGASGSGKTTLLRCITLQDKWDAGHFFFEGRDIMELNALQKRKYRKKWAYIEEKPTLIGDKTALKNVLKGRFYETAWWRKLTGKVKMDEHIMGMDFLEKVGLLDKAHHKANTLSGGEVQRVAIAKALVQGAQIIVADEPISGLDPENAKKVMMDLQNLCQKTNVTVICCLHQVELAEKYATRLWGLSEGKLVFDIKGRRLTQSEKDRVF
ncbi:MAG: phosphonate transporter ATP-binding protein [Bacilli bacterium]|nr:phosphonate transporter ATP-binding protein [Bacilli bacterium]